jgi:hypothetical protein
LGAHYPPLPDWENFFLMTECTPECVLSTYRGFGMYSTIKTWGRKEMFVTKENAATRLSRSQALLG